MAGGYKDYYQILGIGKNASQDEIKQAYRKLAREHHPDMVKDSDKAAAEKRFKEINEAYQVLGDAQKRKMYDQYGTTGAEFGQGGGGFGAGQGQQQGQWGPFTYTYTSGGGNAGANPFGGYEDFDPFDVFESFFGSRGFGSSRQPRKGKNLYYEMVIDFADAVFGLEKEVNVESGKVTIKIPAGVRDGTELRFSNKGMPGPAGASAGDLFITLRVKKPQEFDIAGDNIVVNEEIDFTVATLGGELEVPVVDVTKANAVGYAKLKIPAGTQPGTRFLLRSKGMPKLRGHGQGDVIVNVFVTIPKKISKKQKDILEEYQKS
jgi:DnaJ-class molecular chaperone